MKALRLEEGLSQEVGNVSPVPSEESTHELSECKASPPHHTLWSGVGFDAIQFIGSHFLLSKKFHGYYKTLQSKSPPAFIGINDNLLLRALMLEDINWKRRDHAKKEMNVKLKKYKDIYTEI